jgi:hypothetical protein
MTDALPVVVDPPGSRRWRFATVIVAAIMCAAVSVSVLQIPVQVTDSLVPLLQAQMSPGVVATVTGSFSSTAYLRPFRVGQIQVLYDLADSTGRFYLVFRGFHVALVIAAFALFVTALRVRTRDDWLVACLALTVLTGLHTFLGTVWEAYPINHFLEIAVFCLLALVLTQSRGGWWSDIAAAAVFVVASLTLESGLLVWVVLVAARVVGLRGVSVAGLIVVTVLLGGYLVLRFGVLGTGSPGLDERASGFWTGTLERDEIARRFGDQPAPFYAYNVVASAMSVLVSEPRAGTFALPKQLSATGELSPGTALNVASSALTTLAMVLMAVRRRRAWMARQFTPSDQLLIVAGAVIAANASISYAYTKDETMSVAGVFYAVAAFAAMREAIAWAAHRRWPARLIVAALLLGVGSAWAWRAVGLQYNLRWVTYYVGEEWVTVDQWLADQNSTPRTAEGRQLVEHLRADAIDRYRSQRAFLPRWAERWYR